MEFAHPGPINMPGMRGLELLTRAKALQPDVPVIMITAHGDAVEVVDQRLRVGRLVLDHARSGQPDGG
jgi:FixJ family two-component response regulator